MHYHVACNFCTAAQGRAWLIRGAMGCDPKKGREDTGIRYLSRRPIRDLYISAFHISSIQKKRESIEMLKRLCFMDHSSWTSTSCPVFIDLTIASSTNKSFNPSIPEQFGSASPLCTSIRFFNCRDVINLLLQTVIILNNVQPTLLTLGVFPKSQLRQR